MDGWESVGVSADPNMIWACQNSALDHYEKNPASGNVQDGVFESSLGKNVNATANGKEERPSRLDENFLNVCSNGGMDCEKLIDVETPTSSDILEEEEEEEDVDELKYHLLLRNTHGKKVTFIVEEKYPGSDRKILMEDEDYDMYKGTIVRELDEHCEKKTIIDRLNKIKGFGIPVTSIEMKDAYGVSPEAYLAKLKMNEVRMLRPIATKDRFDFYQDFARFAFVRDLKEEAEVGFKEDSSEEMRRGFLSSRDRDDRGDFYYSVRMEPQRGFSPPRERRNPYRFYDDYEGNEHEGNMIYQVSADRLYPPPPRRELTMQRERRRTPSPPRDSSRFTRVKVLDSPPGYDFVSTSDVEENREGAYHNLSGEWNRFREDPESIRRRLESASPSREKIIPIRLVDSSPSAVGGARNTEDHRQGPYGNLYEVGEGKRAPPTKPRTKFDFLPPLFLPVSGESSNRSRERYSSSEEGRTNGTENHSRYAQEEDWKMNDKYSGMNGGTRNEERKERRECAKATMRLDECEGWRVGDRCQWENEGVTNEATVRWIGRLRGHHSVYAGLHFDEPVGQGTGMYQGNELFNTPANHAGFVMLSTVSPLLISTSSKSHPSSFQTQNQNRERHRDNGLRNEAFDKISYPVEDRVRNASPPIDVPISGQGAMIPPRYKESEMAPSTSGASSTSSARHRPLPPPPPPYDADKPVPHRPSPPSLPPRPAMVPEDYMIESFDVGSCVDVCYKGFVRSGVVRWKGDALNDEQERLEMSVVVELETSEAPPEGWRQSMETGLTGVDHTLSTVLVPISAVRRDRRFAKDSSPLMGNGNNMNGYGGEGTRVQDFGSIDSGVETSKRDPWGGTDELIGRMKGVQGHRNSCYLDSMLYTLFVQCAAFDDILTRRRSEGDIKEYDTLVKILSTEIVWPLRRFHYVRADHVMKLRKELEKALPNIKGLTSEEKDPEEILSSLLRDVFKTKPYLKLINSKTGQIESTWLYHVVVDADEWQGNIASSQHLLERSLRKDSTKLAECPQVFIMQLPRYGVTKLFDKIVPLEKIDMTPFINNTVFACAQCQKSPAELYCHECYLTKEALYGEVSYCVECFRSVHMREGLPDHADRPIPPPSRPTKKMTRYTFTLSGVLAIETSHYVSFVRSSHGRWLFFDSMADREGLQNGFNIPQVRECERASSWLSLSGYQRLRSPPGSLPVSIDDPLVNRLLSDSYICIYTADQPTGSSSNSTTSLLSKLTKELKMNRN